MERVAYVLAGSILGALVALAATTWNGSRSPSSEAEAVSPSSRRQSPLVAELQRELDHTRELLALAQVERLREDERSTAAGGEPGSARASEPELGANELPAEPRPTREEEASGRSGVAEWLRAVLPEHVKDMSDAEIHALRVLDLRGAELTDEDLLRLAHLPNLNSLNLRGTDLTDAGIGLLSGLDLDSLELRGTEISGAALSLLPAYGLEALHLTDTRVRGEDLTMLPAMPELQVLKLNRLDLHDDDLAQLARYPQLRHIELDGTQVTAAGLWNLLRSNPNLHRIELRRTPVSAEELAQIAAAYPNLSLEADLGNRLGFLRSR